MMFQKSDFLFFMGVIHYQIHEYGQAVKCFEESLGGKINHGTLYFISKSYDETTE